MQNWVLSCGCHELSTEGGRAVRIKLMGRGDRGNVWWRGQEGGLGGAGGTGGVIQRHMVPGSGEAGSWWCLTDWDGDGYGGEGDCGPGCQWWRGWTVDKWAHARLSESQMSRLWKADGRKWTSVARAARGADTKPRPRRVSSGWDSNGRLPGRFSALGWILICVVDHAPGSCSLWERGKLLWING